MHILSKKCIVCCASLFFYVPLQRKLAKPATIVSMKAKYLFLLLCTLFTACGVSDTECAQTLINNAQTLVTRGQWRQALIVLDSVHTQYPKEIAQRRIANALADSITYLEAQANIAYTDSILPPLLQQADKLLKLFRYEKNEKYETYGRYVHHLLTTSSNTSRNFLQAYVQDDRTTIVKSYYYGSQSIQQEAITLSANGEEIHAQGSNHRFEANGWHEIMTMEDSRALEVLNFISAHTNDRIRITGQGTKPANTWVYYLTDKEKQALSDTYQLGWLMKDIKRAEEIQNTAQKQIERYQSNHPIQ